jgi:NADPH:quinone reductase-like Zn-dependent oxidoreductase
MMNASKLLPLIAVFLFDLSQGASVCVQAPTSPRARRRGRHGVGHRADCEGAPLIAAGKVRINIDRTYPLEGIVEAQQHNRNGSTRGKVVVAVARVAS